MKNTLDAYITQSVHVEKEKQPFNEFQTNDMLFFCKECPRLFYFLYFPVM